MNPLTRALKLAGDPQPEATARTADGSSRHAVPDRGRLGPIRATRDDPVPETLPPASPAGGDVSGPQTPGGAWLAPMRATRDGAESQIRPPAGLAAGDAHGRETPDGARLAPMRAARDDSDSQIRQPAEFTAGDVSGPKTPGGARLAPMRATSGVAIADGAVSSDDSAAPEIPVPGPAAPTGAPSGPIGAAADDAAAARAVGRVDFRSLRRDRGIGRGVGIALSLLGVTGAAAGGGTFLWKTELARPALVGSLPPLPPALTNPTPVHTANAAARGTPEPAGNAAPPSESPPALPAVAPKIESPSILPAAASGNSGHPSPLGAAPGHDSLPAGPAVALGNDGSPLPPAAAPSSAGSPAPSPSPASQAHTAGSTPVAAPAPNSSSAGLPAPEAPADSNGVAVADGAAPAATQARRQAERETAERVAAADGAATSATRGDAEVPSGSGPRIAILRRKRPDHVAASLERAWEAYLAGDGEAAGQAYRAVLGHEPRNRDARLGLAAVAARAGRWEEAAEHYATLLASHPADTAARAALIALGEKDPARAESRLKALLRIEPEAAHLHFRLGNLYAAQSRWPEARQSWLSAYRLDRGSADHAYNLAVGLDRLSQSRSALDLYRQALVLARASPASFEAETVLKRIRALESRPAVERAPDDTSPEEAAAAAHVR